MKPSRHFAFRRLIATVLFGAMALFISPKELLHEFLHSHEDSSDIRCEDSCEGHVGDLHQHCEIFQLSTPPLYHGVHDFSFTFLSVPFSYLTKNTTAYNSCEVFSLHLRGPPQLT